MKFSHLWGGGKHTEGTSLGRKFYWNEQNGFSPSSSETMSGVGAVRHEPV